jgi:Tol biopolymer transport system component
MNNCVCVTDAKSGATVRLTPRSEEQSAPRPEACVFSPDGKQIAFMRPVADSGGRFNQIFVLRLE